MNYPKGMRLFGLLIFLCLAELLRAQCSCTDCALDLPGGQTTESTIDISGSTNDVLGSNGQAIQAICINFLHDAINEANFKLIAPDGSSVLLVQSTGTSFNDNVFFNICFVACSQAAEPDPGFSEVFDSGENWMTAGIYTGSYYPAVGCLEDLTGSINGEWTLEVDDVEPGDGGELLDWCIQFVDDAGLGCGTTCFEVDCEADGGQIPDLSGTYCQNDPALDLDLTPIFPGGEPDPALYSYNYVYVNTTTNVIEQFSIATDLTFFFPGEYQLCGFSYLTSDFDLLPFPPPVDYTYQDLVDDIDAGAFCADLSDNCITITIDSIPEAPAWTGPTSVCPGEEVTYEVLNYDSAAYDYLFTIVQGSFSQFITNGGSIDVIWNSGPGEICVSASNECGTIDSCLQIQVGSGETVGIDGNTEVCVADFETYTLSPPLEPGQSYVVSVTNGIAFPVQGNTVQVNWDPGTTGQLCVEVVGPGCLPEPACLDVTISPFVPPVFVDNSLSLCIDQTGFAAVPDDPEVTNYNWFGNGFTILSGQGTNEIEIQADEIGTVQTCVELETSCGLDTVCSDLNIFDIPSPMITAAEPTPSCGNEFNVFLVFSPGTDLQWTVIDGPAGGVTLSGDTQPVLNVVVNQTGTYTFQIEESIGSCSGFDTITIDITGGVSTISTIECDPDGNYVVTLELSGGTQPYTVNGEEIVGTLFESDPIPSGDDYNFAIEDANGCTTQVTGMETCPCLTSAGTMDNELFEVCGESGETVTALAPPDAEFDNDDIGVFVLHEGSAGTLINIIESNSTGIFSFQGGMVFGQTYYISYVVGNAQGSDVDLNDPCLSVAPGQPVIFYGLPDISYAGPNEFCETAFALTLDISADVTQTVWNLTSGPGAVNITNMLPGSADISVSEPGTYEFQVISDNGFCVDSLSFDIEINGSLSVTNIDEDCSTPDDYTLTFEINGGVEPYSANIAGNFIGPVFTSDILFTSTTYDITVTDAAGCTVNFTVGPVQCDCVSEAGMMSTELIELCEGDSLITVDFLGGETLDPDDIERFVIHTGSGSVIDNLILETIDENILLPLILLQPGTVYYVSHVVGNELVNGVDFNDPCLDVSPGQPFIINPTPQFSLPDSAETCPGTIGITVNNAGIGGQVALVSNTGGGPVNLELIGNTISVGSGIPTIVEVEYVESNSGCEKRDTVVVSFYDVPEVINVVENCIGTSYTVSFEIEGGFAPFFVNGEQLTGNQFVSDTFDSGETAEFTIRNSWGCITVFSTTVDCACETDAGSLTGTVPDACVGEDIDISSLVLNVGQLDPNDSIYLIVHDGTAADIGNVIDTPQPGVIEYKPDFIAGQTYYITAVAGNNVNGSIDFDDPCFSSTNGLPVTWAEGNTAALTDTVLLCVGDSVLIPVSGSGSFPFDVYLSSDSGRQETVTLSGNSTAVSIVVEPGIETWTIDSIGGVCSATGTGQFVVNGEVVQVPEFVDSPDICNNAAFGSVLNLDDLIVNGVGGSWISADFTIENNSIDFDATQPGVYILNFIPNQALCTPGFYSISVEVLDCDCPIITLPFGIDLCVTVMAYDLDDRFNISVAGDWMVSNPNGLPTPPVIDNGLIDLTGSSPGEYLLAFTITDSIPDQCENEFSVVLNVIPEPEPGMQSFVPSLCEGVSQDLDLNTILSGADPGGTWTFGGATLGNVINSSILNVGPNAFTYTVDNNLCDERSVEVIVQLGEPPEAGVQAENQRWCENTGARISLDGLLDGADPGGIWTYNGEVLDSVVRIDDLDTGRNVIIYEVGIAPCSDTAEVIFYVNPEPDYLLAVLNVSCFGADDGFLAVDTVDTGTGPYTVTINSIEQDQITNAQPATYFIVVEDSIGCQNTEFVTITEPPPLELELTAPDTIMEGDEATVLANTNAADISIEDWQYEGSLVSFPTLALTYIPSATDTVSLEIITENGCTVSDETVIVVIPKIDTIPVDTTVTDEDVDIFVPNVFNPTSQNPDNRRFTLQFDDNVDVVNYVRVFDRWGALVYELTDIRGVFSLTTWNGMYKGKIVNPGVFVYAISYITDTGEEKVAFGDVTVIR